MNKIKSQAVLLMKMINFKSGKILPVKEIFYLIKEILYLIKEIQLLYQSCRFHNFKKGTVDYFQKELTVVTI